MNKLTLETPFQGPPAPVAPVKPASPASRPAPQRSAADRPETRTAGPGATRAAGQKPDQTAGQAASQNPGQEPGGEPGRAPAQPPRLSPAVLAQIANALRQGGPEAPPLAAQADLVALHKRIAEMFTTLNEGLAAQSAQKAAADRAALTARIDQLETAVDRMEGALRIEFEPVLKSALASALAQAAPKPRRRWPARLGRLAGLALAAIALLAAGAWLQAPLAGAFAALAETAADWAPAGVLDWARSGPFADLFPGPVSEQPAGSLSGG